MREPDQELDALAKTVIGAAIEVHRVLGPGFLEMVYEDALCVELELRGISYERQVTVPLTYKGRPIASDRLDLLVDKRLIVENKAVENLAPIHTAIVISYLKATRLQLALLINFHVPLLKHGIHRIINS